MTLTLAGDQGRSIEVDGDTIKIITKGSFFSAKREKTIPVGQITSVEIKEPGVVRGFIQFSIAGQLSANLAGRGTSVNAVLAASKDENAVLFGSAMLQHALAIKAHVESFRAKRESHQAVSPPSALDEIRKLKELLDLGALTADEFDAKKKQLLGL